MSKQPEINTSIPTADSVAQTTCYMCACRCGINVHIKDGEIRYIGGNVIIRSIEAFSAPRDRR